MKLQTEIDIDITAKALYKNGAVHLTVTSFMPYGDGRQAQATIRNASDKVEALFIKAFDELIKEQQARAVEAIQIARAECMIVAARMGEL
jgi:hypothetical protein